MNKRQLTWANWSEICEFVPFPHFIKGVSIGKDGFVLPDGEVNSEPNGIGLLLRNRNGEAVLAKANDWIVMHEDGTYSVEPGEPPKNVH